MNKKIFLLLSFILCCGIIPFAKNPQQPDTYAYTRGVEAYNEDKYADALEWFNRELSEHPDNGYAYVYLSAIRLSNQEYGKAITAIEEALKKLPKKDNVWRALAVGTRAKVHVEMEDTTKALNDLALAIKLDPASDLYYNRRAQLNYELGKYALADADYRKLIDLDPGDVMGYMGIGRNANAQKQWDEAINQFDHVVKLAPEYSSGYSFRAESFMGQEKWAEATNDLLKALDIDGDAKAFYLMQNLPSEAQGLMKTKLKIQMAKQPTNNYWPYCLAIIADKNKEYDEAIALYEKANSLDANSVFMERISKCYSNQKNYPKALDYAERAASINPDDYDIVELKADILSEMGRLDEAVSERDKYVARYPEYSVGYLSRAENLMGAHRFEDAIEDYNTAITLVPPFAEFPYILMKRGDAYRLTGKSAEAVKDYEMLLKVETDSILSAGSWTPFAYSGLGNAEKAIETMQQILNTDTTDVKGSLYNAACIYARLGQNEEAFKYLKEAIAKGYDNFPHIEADYDLDGLRQLPEYKEIVGLKGSEPASDNNRLCEVMDPYIETEIVEIPFTKEGGVTKVKCNINGLPLHFVFDTGAADVTISMVEANFMLKNDYIKPSDIIGTARYMDANGDVTEGTVINLRNVNFGGLDLDNVRASVVRNQKAPLLLGQSVLGRLGKIEIDNPGMKLIITHRK